jgi:peroxiredoxin
MNTKSNPPDWQVAQWFNTAKPLSLATLSGRAVILVAFQMLCPGCATHALPQLQRVRAAFKEADLAVVGLHSVFEHHAAQGTSEALTAFLKEYRITFPVGIDAPAVTRGLPATMQTYQMRGTPTTLIYTRDGWLFTHHFGHIDDLNLGALLAQAIAIQ